MFSHRRNMTVTPDRTLKDYQIRSFEGTDTVRYPLRTVKITPAVKMAYLLKVYFDDDSCIMKRDLGLLGDSELRMISFIHKNKAGQLIDVTLSAIKPINEITCTVVTIDAFGDLHEDDYEFNPRVRLPDWYLAKIPVSV